MGATTTISRKFGSGWEVGGYTTLTDVPFSTFGEGSFDKAIFVSIPIDWITSTPTQAQRTLTLRPITRDGGAQLAKCPLSIQAYKKITKWCFSQGIWEAMEMKRMVFSLIVVSVMASCSNTPELETGEIKTLASLEQAFKQLNKPKRFIDAQNLLTREQIDKAAVPVLFVKLPSGQNGTLTPYPGQGIGQTWLGADGATITLQRGVLMASRGMGNDLMGSTSSMPPWSEIKKKKQTYSRALNHITGNNKIFNRTFRCEIQKSGKGEIIKIWDVSFKVAIFEENCHDRINV